MRKEEGVAGPERGERDLHGQLPYVFRGNIRQNLPYERGRLTGPLAHMQFVVQLCLVVARVLCDLDACERLVLAPCADMRAKAPSRLCRETRRFTDF